MPVAVTVEDVWHDSKKVHVIGKLTFSGSYVSGGDTVDLTSQPRIKSSRPPLWFTIQGRAGFVYEWVEGSTLANGKVIVRGQEPTNATGGVIALSQIAAAAYPAGVTGDTVEFHGIFDIL